jgi:hypothetical protein
MKHFEFDLPVQRLSISLLAAVVVLVAAAGTKADYRIVWSTIDSGGGTSSGGQYSLTGTIGQPDAAYSSGGNYELLGGFWPGGPLCFVQFDDFARFAGYWLASGSGLPGDLDGDNDVDLEDLSRFADYWLACCPYKWSLN